MDGMKMVPERAGREGEQRMPCEGVGDMIGELIRKLEERRALGVRRYGRALQAFNDRDPFKDAEDELIDKHAYLTQARYQYQAIREALLVLAEYVRNPMPSPATDAALALAEKLRLRKGDVLAMQVRKRLTVDELEHIKARWREIARDAPGVTVVIDDGGRVLRLPWWLRWLLRWS